MGDIIQFKKEHFEYAECSVCGSTVWHNCIEDDPDDPDCYIFVGHECACCHCYTDLTTCKQ